MNSQFARRTIIATSLAALMSVPAMAANTTMTMSKDAKAPGKDKSFTSVEMKKGTSKAHGFVTMNGKKMSKKEFSATMAKSLPAAQNSMKNSPAVQ